MTPTYTAVAADAGNIVTLTLTAQGNADCADDTDQMDITIEHAVVANAGSDATICENSAYTVNDASVTNGNGTYNWTHNGNGTLTDANTLNPTYTAVAADAGNIVTLTLTAQGNADCADDTDQMDITIEHAVAANADCADDTDQMDITIEHAVAANAGSDAAICENSAYTVNDASVTNGNGTYNWTHNGNGTLADANTLTPTYTAVAADAGNIVTLTLTAQGNADCADDTDQMDITVEHIPEVDAGPDITICYNDSVYLTSADTTFSSNVIWNTSGSGTWLDDDSTTITPVYIPSDQDKMNGTVRLYIQATGSPNCNVVTDSTNINIPPQLEAAIGTPAPFIIGNNTKINVCLTTLDHQLIQDLSYYLVAPDGLTEIALAESPISSGSLAPCNFGTDADICFSSEETVPLNICQGNATLTGTHAASGDWSKIFGFNPSEGGWKVLLRDHASYGTNEGELIYASITFTDTTDLGELISVTYDSGPINEPIQDGDLNNPGETAYAVPIGVRVSCFGSCDASVIVNAIGGTPPYVSYEWSDPALPNDSAVDLCSGTYTVTVTDALGCTAEASVDVISPPEINISSLTFNDTLDCNGDTTAILLTATGGTGTLEYTIDGINFYNSGAKIDSVFAGNYTITVRDMNECTMDTTITIHQPDPIHVEANVSDILCKGDSTGIIEVIAENGSPDYIFSLFKDGNPLAVEISPDTATFLVTADSSYTITIEDANGCLADYTDTLIINEPDTRIQIDSVIVNPIICNNGTGSIEIQVSGGTPSYQYSINGDTITHYQTDSLFAGLGEGLYNIWAMDGNGCSVEYGSNPVEIINPDPIITSSTIVTDVTTCYGESTGELSLNASGGAGTLYFSIDDSTTWQDSARFVNLPVGEYFTFVRDSLGCTVPIDSVIIDQPAPLNLLSDHTNISCHGYNDGTITALMTGGTAPYTYELVENSILIDTKVSNDTAQFLNLPPGDYTVYAYDLNLCDTLGNAEIISEPGILTFDAYTKDIVCHGDSGKLIIDVTGGVEPYFYMINGGVPIAYEDSSVLKMPAGIDTITIQDANGCISGTDTIIRFTEPPEITLASFYASNIKCAGGLADTLLFTGFADTLELEYSIDGINYQPDSIFSDIEGGPITMYIRDIQRGCVRTFDSIIYEPEPLTFDSIHVVYPSGEDTKDGIITSYVSGGTGNYYYSIDSASSFITENSFDSLQTGTYLITVKDDNDCTIDTTLVLDYNELDVNIKDIIHPLCHNDTNGSIEAEVINGNEPFIYILINDDDQSELERDTTSSRNYVFSSLPGGSYRIRVIDNNDRIFNSPYPIPLDNPDPVDFASVYIDPITCSGGISDSIQLIGSGGTGIFEYSIDSINYQSSGVFSDIEGGSLSLYIRDGNGCAYRKDTVIFEPEPITIDTIITTIVSGEGKDDGSITILARGGTGSLEYSIDDGQSFQSDSSFSDLTTGVYEIVIRDQNGCTLDTIAEVTGLAVTITDILPSCYGMEDGAIILEINDQGVSPFIFSIDGEGGLTQGISLDNDSTYRNLASGNYEIFIQDAFGRTYNTNYFLNQPDPLEFSANASYAKCQIPIDGTDIGSITLDIDGGTMPYDYLSVYDFTKVNDSTITIENLTSGDYTINITDANRCNITDTITVEPDPRYRIPINLFTSPAQFPACYNTVVELTVDPENATAGNFINPLNDKIITSSEFYSFQLTENREIIYRAVNDTAGCMNEEFILADMHPRLNLELMEDTVLLSETSSYLIPSLNEQLLQSTQFRWIALNDPAHLDYLNDPYIAYPIFTAPKDVDSVSYELIGRTVEGCNENDTIGIEIITTINFPSGFTPNGDGANDEWIISEALLGRAKVEVFNRWGKRVFYSDGYSDPWDGTYNGKPLPVGTYYYVVTLKIGDAEPVTGTITIMR